MATYRVMSPIFVNGRLIEAGQVVSDTGLGALLPANFVPSGACDPMDADAIQKFWNVGPREMDWANASVTQGTWGTQGGRWTGVTIAPPTIYWTPFRNPNPNNEFILTGVGAVLGMKQAL
jgi:hypothetical protein